MKAISLQEAVAFIPEGASLMIGGFVGVGTPERIIDEIVRQKKRVPGRARHPMGLEGLLGGEFCGGGFGRLSLSPE